ncbi:unnamed protein product [Rangifer tarandus platyrhynchus]|uniref:Uncharacterized protein n=1 Tax=Rangifer tarandus platyrhynchus TaxID=3082113 RepID=A0AC59Z335_RANTA
METPGRPACCRPRLLDASRHLATRPQFLSALHPPTQTGRGASAQGLPGPGWVVDSPSDSRPTALPTQGALGTVLAARRLGRQARLPRKSNIRKPGRGPLAKISARPGQDDAGKTPRRTAFCPPEMVGPVPKAYTMSVSVSPR